MGRPDETTGAPPRWSRLSAKERSIHASNQVDSALAEMGLDPLSFSRTLRKVGLEDDGRMRERLAFLGDLGLHGYQVRQRVETLLALIQGRSGIVQAPTGSGKSFAIASAAADGADIAGRKPIVIFNPSAEILEQNLERMAEAGLLDGKRVGFYADKTKTKGFALPEGAIRIEGRPFSEDGSDEIPDFVFATTMCLLRRPDEEGEREHGVSKEEETHLESVVRRFGPNALVLFDEGHSAAAPETSVIFGHLAANGCPSLFYSATPFRTDGKNLLTPYPAELRGAAREGENSEFVRLAEREKELESEMKRVVLAIEKDAIHEELAGVRERLLEGSLISQVGYATAKAAGAIVPPRFSLLKGELSALLHLRSAETGVDAGEEIESEVKTRMEKAGPSPVEIDLAMSRAYGRFFGKDAKEADRRVGFAMADAQIELWEAECRKPDRNSRLSLWHCVNVAHAETIAARLVHHADGSRRVGTANGGAPMRVACLTTKGCREWSPQKGKFVEISRKDFLAKARNGGYDAIANCKALGVGSDIRTIGIGVLAFHKRCLVSVVQAIGRSARTDRANPGKTCHDILDFGVSTAGLHAAIEENDLRKAEDADLRAVGDLSGLPQSGWSDLREMFHDASAGPSLAERLAADRSSEWVILEKLRKEGKADAERPRKGRGRKPEETRTPMSVDLQEGVKILSRTRKEQRDYQILRTSNTAAIVDLKELGLVSEDADRTCAVVVRYGGPFTNEARSRKAWLSKDHETAMQELMDRGLADNETSSREAMQAGGTEEAQIRFKRAARMLSDAHVCGVDLSGEFASWGENGRGALRGPFSARMNGAVAAVEGMLEDYGRIPEAVQELFASKLAPGLSGKAPNAVVLVGFSDWPEERRRDFRSWLLLPELSFTADLLQSPTPKLYVTSEKDAASVAGFLEEWGGDVESPRILNVAKKKGAATAEGVAAAIGHGVFPVIGSSPLSGEIELLAFHGLPPKESSVAFMKEKSPETAEPPKKLSEEAESIRKVEREHKERLARERAAKAQAEADAARAASIEAARLRGIEAERRQKERQEAEAKKAAEAEAKRAADAAAAQLKAEIAKAEERERAAEAAKAEEKMRRLAPALIYSSAEGRTHMVKSVAQIFEYLESEAKENERPLLPKQGGVLGFSNPLAVELRPLVALVAAGQQRSRQSPGNGVSRPDKWWSQLSVSEQAALVQSTCALEAFAAEARVSLAKQLPKLGLEEEDISALSESILMANKDPRAVECANRIHRIARIAKNAAEVAGGEFLAELQKQKGGRPIVVAFDKMTAGLRDAGLLVERKGRGFDATPDTLARAGLLSDEREKSVVSAVAAYYFACMEPNALNTLRRLAEKNTVQIDTVRAMTGAAKALAAPLEKKRETGPGSVGRQRSGENHTP